MNFGLSPSEFESLKRLAIDPLKTCGARIFIFGSRSTGKHDKYSDIDNLVELPQSNGAHGILTQARESIEGSNFPIKVDLVDAAELAKSYQANVMSERIEV
jgi:predicted nucleotidyltransferase